MLSWNESYGAFLAILTRVARRGAWVLVPRLVPREGRDTRGTKQQCWQAGSQLWHSELRRWRLYM